MRPAVDSRRMASRGINSLNVASRYAATCGSASALFTTSFWTRSCIRTAFTFFAVSAVTDFPAAFRSSTSSSRTTVLAAFRAGGYGSSSRLMISTGCGWLALVVFGTFGSIVGLKSTLTLLSPLIELIPLLSAPVYTDYTQLGKWLQIMSSRNLILSARQCIKFFRDTCNFSILSATTSANPVQPAGADGASMLSRY